MPHPLVLALFDQHDAAASGAAAVRALGVAREQLSIVARSHREEGALAREMGGTPGVEIEDSRRAARLGELGGQVLAAIAVVMPGIGPIVTAGPLSAELGEAAGHVAGSLQAILREAGLGDDAAVAWEARVERGGILLGVHAMDVAVDAVTVALERSGARSIAVGEWSR